ncbi:MAG TPA: DNA-binding domain-containing protein, partial [Candidatus Acidoferrum sp.]|nr:DNA-binding domain-containing protein [Candidatus Acidoferrum sp.]
MSLMRLQRTMARAVMQPLTAAERMQRRAPGGGSMRRYAARFIKPNDHLTSFERLEIYNRQYWFRVLSALSEDFPGLRAVIGGRQFDAMAKAYIVANPSRSFTLRDLGSRLESWLRKNPKWTGDHRPLALDIVRLEWADLEAFDGKGEPPLQPEDLPRNADAKLKLLLQPYIRMLSLHYPVDDLLLDVRKEEEDTDFASNAFSERRKRKRVRAVAKLEPAKIFLAVHRMDNSVYFRRLEPEEFAILAALRQGTTLGGAVKAAFRESAIPPGERPDRVQTWFYTWASLGWFCR